MQTYIFFAKTASIQNLYFLCQTFFVAGLAHCNINRYRLSLRKVFLEKGVISQHASQIIKMCPVSELFVPLYCSRSKEIHHVYD